MERKVGLLVGALAPMLALSSSDAGTGAGTYIRCSMNIELYSLNIHLLSRDRVGSYNPPNERSILYYYEWLSIFYLSPLYYRKLNDFSQPQSGRLPKASRN